MIRTFTINQLSKELDMRRLGQFLRNFDTDKQLIVKVTEQKETRRTQQNRLLWLWHGEFQRHIQEHLGDIYSTADIHEYIVEKLLPNRVIELFGEPSIRRAETSKLKVREFSQFLNQYEMWAAETYQCFFTRPDDLYLSALMKDAA